VLAVKPRNFDANGNPIVDNNWTPATPPTPQPVSSRGYRVLAVAQTKSQQTQLRALFPEAFPTSYNGRALWQIGLFSNQENAQQALGSIKNAGLDGVILQ
jgi:hypothetical protein